LKIIEYMNNLGRRNTSRYIAKDYKLAVDRLAEAVGAGDHRLKPPT